MARKTTTTTTTTVRKKGDVDAANVAVEESEGGLTLDDGIVLSTTLALIGAIVLVYFAVQGMPGPIPA